MRNELLLLGEDGTGALAGGPAWLGCRGQPAAEGGPKVRPGKSGAVREPPGCRVHAAGLARHCHGTGP